MDIEQLDASDIIRIGSPEEPQILYVWASKARRDEIVLETAPPEMVAHPVAGPVPRAAEAMCSDPDCRVLLIFHHSNAEQIARRIRESLSRNGCASSVSDTGGARFRCGLRDMVMAYPPFARRFLSEVRDTDLTKWQIGAEKSEDGTGSSAPRSTPDGDGPSGPVGIGGDNDQDTADESTGDLKRRGAGPRLGPTGRLGILLVITMGLAVAASWPADRDEASLLEAVRAIQSDPFGRDRETILARVVRSGSVAIGLSDPEPVPGSHRDVPAAEAPAEPDRFSAFFNPIMAGDTGRSFGLPIEVDTFRVRTWVRKTEAGDALYAAYAVPDAQTRTYQDPDRRRVSREIFAKRLRAHSVVRAAEVSACAALSDRFDVVDVIATHGRLVLSEFRFDPEVCAVVALRDNPDRQGD